jgi:hypothetical protein
LKSKLQDALDRSRQLSRDLQEFKDQNESQKNKTNELEKQKLELKSMLDNLNLKVNQNSKREE